MGAFDAMFKTRTSEADLGISNLEWMRLEREQEWADINALEHKVAQPYLDNCEETDAEKLVRITKQIEGVLGTNANLQEQVREQEGVSAELQQERDEGQKALEVLQAELRRGKEHHTAVEQQLKELREQRVAEERRLRDKSVALHTRMTSLLREKCMLEQQQRVEETQRERNDELLQQLRVEGLKLEQRKQEFDIQDEEEDDEPWAGHVRKSSAGIADMEDQNRQNRRSRGVSFVEKQGRRSSSKDSDSNAGSVATSRSPSKQPVLAPSSPRDVDSESASGGYPGVDGASSTSSRPPLAPGAGSVQEPFAPSAPRSGKSRPKAGLASPRSGSLSNLGSL